MNTDRILHISLICLGSLGMFLSVLAASLIWIFPCSREWCFLSQIIMVIEGVVNFILSAIPVIIGWVHVHAEKKSVDLALCILFSILAVPNIVVLFTFNLNFFIQTIISGDHEAWYFALGISMSFVYVIDIILCWVTFGRKSCCVNIIE